jgi:hypothetical protein
MMSAESLFLCCTGSNDRFITSHFQHFFHPRSSIFSQLCHKAYPVGTAAIAIVNHAMNIKAAIIPGPAKSGSARIEARQSHPM